MTPIGYLRIDNIRGESRCHGHEGEIDIFGIAWKVQQLQSSLFSSGRMRARSDVGPLTCFKPYDASSPYLALAAMKGMRLPEAVLTLSGAAGESSFEYLQVTIRDLVVVDYEILPAESGGATDRPRERFSLDFEAVKITYTEQDDDGSAGSEHEVDYDVVTGS